jgi:hypothetical protein
VDGRGAIKRKGASMEKIEFWGFREPQGQVAVFSADQIEKMRRFVLTGGRVEIRIVSGAGTFGGSIPDFKIGG